MNDEQKLVEKLRSRSFCAVIFDFDGTVIDIKEPLKRAIEEAFAEYGIKDDIDQTIREIGSVIESVQGYPIPKIILQSHDIFQQLTIFKEFRFLKKLRISMKIFTKFMTYSKEAELVPGAKALIEFFKGAEECKLYLVSHNQTKTILEHVERLEIKEYFTGIYGADEIPALKPDPKAFQPVLNQHKECGIKQFLVLGDMPTDIQAAKEAGLHSIAVASGISTKEILSAYYPDLMVESLEELIKIIDTKDVSNFESKNSLKIKS